jgi:hypothetical protein
MAPERPRPRAGAVPRSAGLCALCRHARSAGNARGSVFVLCRRSATDPRFPRYPALPVMACAGFDASAAGQGGEQQGHEADHDKG